MSILRKIKVLKAKIYGEYVYCELCKFSTTDPKEMYSHLTEAHPIIPDAVAVHNWLLIKCRVKLKPKKLRRKFKKWEK